MITYSPELFLKTKSGKNLTIERLEVYNDEDNKTKYQQWECHAADSYHMNPLLAGQRDPKIAEGCPTSITNIRAVPCAGPLPASCWSCWLPPPRSSRSEMKFLRDCATWLRDTNNIICQPSIDTQKFYINASLQLFHDFIPWYPSYQDGSM